MLEIASVAAFFALLGLFGAMFMLPWKVLGILGFWILVVGVVVGVPAGVAWHIALYRALHPRGLLPANWYWRPMDYHELLEYRQRGLVLGLCYLGAGGFFAIVLGSTLLTGAAVSIWAQHM